MATSKEKFLLKLVAAPLFVLLVVLTLRGLYTEPVFADLAVLWPGRLLHETALLAAVFFVGAGAVVLPQRFRRYHRLITLIFFCMLSIGTVGLGSLFAASFFVLSALAAGSVVWRNDACDQELRTLYDALVSLAVGLVFWGMAAWLFFHFKINFPFFHVPLLCAPLWLRRRPVIAYLNALRHWVLDPDQAQGACYEYILPSFAIGTLAFSFLLGLFPTVTFDAMAQHLRLINFVRYNGYWDFSPKFNGILLTPSYFENYYYALCGIIGFGESTVRLLHSGLYIFAALGFWALLLERTNRTFAWLGMALVTSSPIILQVIGGLYAEVSLIFAVLALCIAMQNLRHQKGWVPYVAFGAVLAFPLLLKPTGLMVALPVAVALLAFLLLRHKAGQALTRFAATIATFLLLLLPPYIQAYWMTGNPIFPYLNDKFQSPYFATQQALVDTRWVGHISWDMLYKMVFDSGLFGEISSGAMGFQWILLVPFAFVAPLIRRRKGLFLAWTMSTLYAVLLLMSYQYIRYLTPIFPLVIGLGLVAIFDSFPSRFARSVVSLILLASCVLNLGMAPSGFVEMRGNSLRSLFSQQGRAKIVRKRSSIRFVGQHIAGSHGAASRVAFLGYPGGCDVPGTVYYPQRVYTYTFWKFMKESRGEADMARFIDEEGITHFVVQLSRFKHPHRTEILEALEALSTSHYIYGDVRCFIFD